MGSSQNKVFLVGAAYRNKQEKEPVGFKFLEYHGDGQFKFRNTTYADALTAYKNNPDSFVGLTIEDGKLKGSNGDFSRYQRIYYKGPENFPVIILGSIGDLGYEVVAPSGKVLSLVNKDVITLAKKYGIANGKVVDNNGTEFISAIKGEYPVSPKSEKLTSNKPVQTQQKPVQQPTTNTVTPVQAKQPVKAVEQTQQKPVQNTLNRQSGPVDIVPQPVAKPATHRKIFDQIREAMADEKDDQSNTRQSVVNSAGVAKSLSRNSMIVESTAGTDHEMTVEQMLAASINQMRNAKPFFFAALKVIPRIESTDIPTAAVSIDKFFYNTEFLSKLTVPELNFITLHEISHIMMKHHVRRMSRDPEIWNIACDYYINKAICDEFDVGPGKPAANFGDNNKAKIKFAEGGLYNSKVDIKSDTPERIYEELRQSIKKSAQQNQQNQQNQQGNQNQSGNQSGQQGNQSGQQGNQSGQQSGQQSGGQGQQGQQGNQSGNQSGQQGQGQGSGNQRGNQQSGNGFGGQQSGQQSGGPGQGSGNQRGNQQNGNGSGGQSGNQKGNQNGQGGSGGQFGDAGRYEATFRGDKIDINKVYKDMVKDTESASNSDTTNQQKADSVLQKANTVYKQVLESGTNSGKGKGMAGVVEAFVEKELIPKVNWRSLVQNRLIAKKTEEKSLSSPDRRFVHRGLYIEGDVKDDEKLEGIKLCVDTSGSMSDKDIAIAIGQIMQLCKMYETQADLIYWDDGIQDIIPFDKLTELDLKHYRAMGRGGTDPNCIFEEFSKKDYLYGKKVPPSLIIIFTDGFFGPVDMKYKGKFGKDTVWVLCAEASNNENFNPTFGRLAHFLGK